ncbi:MAG: late competence development ComFB family protein [Clostridiales Family XIII bacterium]|jgi:competence protein ComFB|nr:late competence development ComFB family protein [Clostridiales Family XIII bacterium]
MARRDNKTEHVMKLITKDGAATGDLSENDAGGAASAEATLRRTEGEPLNYKTKLKIEIEPEVEVKEPVRLRQPRGQAVSVSPRESDANAAERDLRTPSSAPDHVDALESIPDGTPYEKLNEDRAVPTPAPAPAPLSRPATTMSEEVRALREADIDIMRQAEQKRAKKIQIESALLSRSRSLINLSEVLTKELLPSVMDRMDVCTCPVCTGNVLALALNALPSKYVTTDEGKQYTQLVVYRRQNELDVIAALTRACLRVKDSPRHEIIDDLED